MRLLHVRSFDFHERYPPIPPYAIASHRWTRGTEATIGDVRNRQNIDKKGYIKVQGFVEYVKTHIPHVEWLWIDTCCINQDSSQEVSEAINSMFKWYRDAEVCLTYLADVTKTSDLQGFIASVWFRRGWTLQELLAPQTVLFLTKDWLLIGHKGTGRGKSGFDINSGSPLTSAVQAATKIPERVLIDFAQSKRSTVQEKLEWTAGRETTLEEDLSYSLLGIFDISMPVLYGEGGEKARKRLLKEIQEGMKDDQQQPPWTQADSEIQLSRVPKTLLYPHGQPGNHDTHPGSQHYQARDRSNRVCAPVCSCICHCKQSNVTPKLLDQLLGTLTINFRGFMAALRICSEPTCAGQKSAHVGVNYRPPKWAIRRAVIAYCTYTTNTMHFSLSIPWIVGDNSEIMHHVKAGDLQAVQRLFGRGEATPQCINASWSVPLLNYAVQFHHLKLCALLLNEGANPRDENDSGISALDIIRGMILSKSLPENVENDFRATFRLWTQSDWVEERQFHPIHKITLGFHGEHIAQTLQPLLVLSAADIDCRDSKGQTALLWAGIRGDHDATKTLLKFGANPNLPSNTGNTALLQAARSPSVAAVKYLIEAGAEVSWKSRQQFTALHYATYYRDNRFMIEELINGGADFEAKDSEGWTPLACAAVRNSMQTASVLLQRGACVESRDNEGWTPLLHAIDQNSHTVLALLLQNHASRSAATKQMETILHIASRRADCRSIELLSSTDLTGVDYQLRNTDGQTAEDIHASREGCEWEFENLLKLVPRYMCSLASGQLEDEIFEDAIEVRETSNV